MRVILTESQIREIQHVESISNILSESIGRGFNMAKLKKTIKRLLYAGVAVTTIIAAINKQDIPNSDKDMLIQTVLNDNSKDFNSANDEIRTDDNYQEKVDAVRAYMEYALSNQGYTLNSTDLNPETLVDVSIESGIELPFIMAVAHQESCFGATPRAKRTNSVFSEGSYDDGRNVVKYSDANDSVMGYVKLLKRSYLVNGKKLMDLLEPGCFVNGVGNRYASDKNYENKIKNIRSRIMRMYPILA